METTEARAYVSSAIIAAPMAVTPVALSVPAVGKGILPPRDAILTGAVAFMEKTDLHPWLNTIVSCSEAGHIQAAVLNTTSEPVPIRKGTPVSYTHLTLPTTPYV